VNFSARTSWTGSTAAGWDAYGRTHSARAEPAKQELTVTTAERLGDPDHLNPEQLLLMAASSCQLLWFLHLAAKARVDVVSYEDSCEAEMPDDRLTRVVLRPTITVSGDVSEDRVVKLCEQAHRHCNIAKSLSCPVELEPRLAYTSQPK
jgi:organic hydroperoxide reductase OsmC/OhrA